MGTYTEVSPHISLIAPFTPGEREDHDEELRLRIGHIIAGRWRVDKHLRDGQFGSVLYEVNDVKRPIRSYMIKV